MLLRAIAGLCDVEAGSIRVGPTEVVHASYRQKRLLQAELGMLFQNVALFDFLTVGENIAFPLVRRGGLTGDAIRALVGQELEEVGLPGFSERMPAELSGGQKRRVGIARAAITRPPFLLYDEPAAGLDPVTASRIFLMLREMQQRLGSTLIVVSSDIDRLLPITDLVAVMHRGRVLSLGPEQQVRSSTDPVVSQFLEGRTDGPL